MRRYEFQRLLKPLFGRYHTGTSSFLTQPTQSPRHGHRQPFHVPNVTRIPVTTISDPPVKLILFRVGFNFILAERDRCKRIRRSKKGTKSKKYSFQCYFNFFLTYTKFVSDFFLAPDASAIFAAAVVCVLFRIRFSRYGSPTLFTPDPAEIPKV